MHQSDSNSTKSTKSIQIIVSIHKYFLKIKFKVFIKFYSPTIYFINEQIKKFENNVLSHITMP